MSVVVNFYEAHIDVFQQKCKLPKKQKILCIKHQVRNENVGSMNCNSFSYIH